MVIIITFVITCVTDFFLPRAGMVILELILPIRILKRATRLQGRFFNMSNMRAHVAADARVTSGALYL